MQALVNVLMHPFLVNALMFSFFGWSFLRRYREDQGKHRTAKIIHFIVIMALGWYYVSSIQNVAWFLRNASSFFSLEDLSFFPDYISIGALTLRTVLSLVFFFQCYWMIRRDSDARTWFLRLTPILGVLEIFEFFRVGLYSYTRPSLLSTVLTIIGVVAVSVGLLYLYRMPFMRRFYLFEHQDSAEQLIDEIGKEES